MFWSRQKKQFTIRNVPYLLNQNTAANNYGSIFTKVVGLFVHEVRIQFVTKVNFAYENEVKK